MALARVVSFEGVTRERVKEIQREMNESEPPKGMPATEILMLHDPDAETSLVVVLFDDDDDYARGDEILNAMSAEETPGRRSSVTKYQVAARRTF